MVSEAAARVGCEFQPARPAPKMTPPFTQPLSMNTAGSLPLPRRPHDQPLPRLPVDARKRPFSPRSRSPCYSEHHPSDTPAPRAPSAFPPPPPTRLDFSPPLPTPHLASDIHPPSLLALFAPLRLSRPFTTTLGILFDSSSPSFPLQNPPPGHLFSVPPRRRRGKTEWRKESPRPMPPCLADLEAWWLSDGRDAFDRLVSSEGLGLEPRECNPRRKMHEAMCNIFRRPEDGALDASRALAGLEYLDMVELHRRRLLNATRLAMATGVPDQHHPHLVEELHRQASFRYRQFHMDLRACVSTALELLAAPASVPDRACVGRSSCATWPPKMPATPSRARPASWPGSTPSSRPPPSAPGPRTWTSSLTRRACATASASPSMSTS